MSLALTILSLLVMLSAGAFVTLYWWSARWWRSDTGRNQMAMAGCLIALGAGTATRHFPWGPWSILAAALLVAVVMIWRTVIMWRYTHPRNAPQQPTMPERGWYTPTPSSVIEPHRNRNQQ